MPLASRTISQRLGLRLPVSTYPGKSYAPPTATGKLFAWGYNKNGELGQGNHGSYGSPYYSKYSPVQVGALTTWVSGFVQASEAFMKHSDGSLWAWGRNALGQLGLGDITARCSPTQIGSLTTWGRVTGGSDAGGAGIIAGKAYNWGQVFFPTFNYISAPAQVGSLTTWQDFVTQEQWFMGIIGGKLYGWGNNDHYQLGLGFASPLQPNISSPTQVGTSSNWWRINKGWQPTTSALDGDRKLWVWGFTNAGQLGNNGAYQKYATRPTLAAPGHTWKQVVGSASCFIGIDCNNYLWTWGTGNQGQLGNGTHGYSNSPIQVGTNKWKMVDTAQNHCIAIRSDGTLWTWGANNYGKLGNGQHGIPNTNPFLNSQSSPVQIGTENTWTWCGASKYNSFGIRT